MVLWGLGIWLLAIGVLRGCGQWMFANPGTVAVLFGISIPLMIWLPRRIVAHSGRALLTPAAAAIALVVPAMLLDSVTTLTFRQVFPNLQPASAALFAAWILFCNAIALASLYGYRPQPSS